MAVDESEALDNLPELTVSELSGAIKRTMEDAFGQVRLRGEISGFQGPHSSGHCYFALKDESARIDAVVWRGVYQRLKDGWEQEPALYLEARCNITRAERIRRPQYSEVPAEVYRQFRDPVVPKVPDTIPEWVTEEAER